MKLNPKRAKKTGINTGVALVAGIAAFAATKTIAEKMPENKAAKFAPHAMVAAALILPALDIVPDSDVVNSALLGAGVVSGISAINTHLAPAEGEDPNALGLKSTLRKYVPQLSGVGYASLGNVYEYTEPMANSLIEAGNYYKGSNNTVLGNVLNLENAAASLLM
jgi:hypothetical protein